MLPTPKKFKLVAGSGEGGHSLTAFDAALLNAGIGNVNLLRVSSILPPGAIQDQELIIPPGSLVPVAYASITSAEEGEQIAAAVGVGLSGDSFGVIMELSGRCSKQEAENGVARMIEEAFAVRKLTLCGMLVKGVEHRVVKIGAAFAAVPMWY